MKKIQHFIALAGLMLLVAACHFGGRSTTIIENADGNSVKIVYHGQLILPGMEKASNLSRPMAL